MSNNSTKGNVETAIKQYLGTREIAGQNPNIDLYQQWYKGYDPTFHSYKIFTGMKEPKLKTRKHLPTSQIICETWANLLLNEKTDFKMEKEDKEKMDKILFDNNFWHKGNALVQKAFALSIGAFVVDVAGLEADLEKGTITSKEKAKIKIQCVNATRIYPITIENGEITECAFATQNTQNSYISLHLIDEETKHYIIYVLHYKDKEFKTFDYERSYKFDTLSDIPFFAPIYPNIVDNDDIDNQLGCSIFQNHIDQMKSIDVKYDLFYHEFIHGKKRTYISTKIKMVDNKYELVDTLNNTDDDVYSLPIGEDGKNLIQVDSSDLRTQQCVEALNSELSMLGYSVGFGKGFLTFNAESAGRPIQTATASMMQNNDLFRSTHRHEIIIEQALKKLLTAIVYANNTFTDQPKFSENAKDNIEILFDDSVFEDKEAEKNTARTDMQNGLISEVDYLTKFYGYTEEEAKGKLVKNPTYLANKTSALLPALQSGAITVDDYVETIWFKKDEQIISYIKEQLDKNSGFTPEDLLAGNITDKSKDENKA